MPSDIIQEQYRFEVDGDLNLHFVGFRDDRVLELKNSEMYPDMWTSTSTGEVTVGDCHFVNVFKAMNDHGT